MALFGLYLIGSVLLVVAGLAKARRPDDTARALDALVPGRRSSPGPFRTAVRVAALLEAALGLVAVALPRTLPAALVAVSYVAFSLVVATAARRGGVLSTCGCFGRPDSVPTRTHVALTLLLAAAALAVSLDAPAHSTLGTALATQPWHGLPLLLAGAVGTWLTLLALSALAALEGARRLLGPAAHRSVSPS